MTAIALPYQAAWPTGRTARLGPFVDSSGDLWAIGYNGGPQAVKSADGGNTWALVGTPPSSSNPLLDCAFDATNGVIYTLCMLNTSVMQIWKFTISTGTWTRVDSGTGPTVTPITYQDGSNQYTAFLCRLSTGSFVVLYQGPASSHKGNPYQVVNYATCTAAGSWSSGTAFYDASAVPQNVYLKCAVVGASDRVHGYLMENNMYHRSLSGGTLDTAEEIGTGNGNPLRYYQMYYSSQLGVVMAKGLSETAPWRATSVANPAWTEDTGWATSEDDYDWYCSTAVIYEPTSGLWFSFYRDYTSGNLYMTTASGTVWGATPRVIDTATDILGISVTLIGNGAIGILYSDGGTMYYDSIVVGPEPLSGSARAQTNASAAVSYPGQWQEIVPSTDVTVTGWLPSTPGASLSSMIDDSSDSTYIYSTI